MAASVSIRTVVGGNDSLSLTVGDGYLSLITESQCRIVRSEFGPRLFDSESLTVKFCVCQ